MLKGYFDGSIIAKFKRFVQSILYFGSNYKCSVCEGTFRKFLPYGIEKRTNARCPKCGTLERHRLIWLFLKNETNFFNDKLKVLHFAPEPFFLDRFSKLTNLTYFPADLTPLSPLVRKINITNIPSEDNFYDCVICCHVLEHIHDDQRAMREIFRVLKIGGYAILQVPIGRLETFEDPNIKMSEDRQRIFGQSDHVRIYGLDYKKRLEEAGFKVNVISYVNKYDSETIKKYALSQADIYFCLKQPS